MSIDIQRGWQLCEQSKVEEHHERCSWRTDRMLCDCDVVMRHPEQLERGVLYGKDGKVLKRYDQCE